ncbi:fumarylacetoacetate hydrolase family protein [Massilia suwonensis]|uniref:Fumarylacetoacetate hydrolase family protein n=1 Tax=Massilia suwonensis TaxID=648895 RepID=A0ABW0MQZ9_9BURK
MKLASIQDGSRDGQLAVVARDLKTAHMADAIAPTLQAALDDWAFIAPQLDALYEQLNAGQARRAFDFDPAHCMAPLPRAHGWAIGAAWPRHLELDYRARGAEPPSWLEEEPLLLPGAAGDLLGPCDDVQLAHEEWGIDFGAGVAAVFDDLAAGVTPDQAHGRIRLLMLVNDIGLLRLMPDELARGGLLQSKPATAFSPVALTPDELGEAWRGGKLHLRLKCSLNGNMIGQPDAGADMAFNFPQLAAHLCKTRRLRAGSIIGAGPVANREKSGRGAAAGDACLIDVRNRETIADGEASTPFLRFGDTVRIEMLDEKGKSVFGAIEQKIVKL